MKRTLSASAAALVSLVLCLFFGDALFRYTRPIGDSAQDLSLMWEGEGMPEDWVYDQKGWSVFTCVDGRLTPLIPDGFGGFSGSIQPGQTFYFSRVLPEELENPKLRLDAYSRGVAVFLDDSLLYSDFPDQDNRIGHIRLKDLERERDLPIIVNLPAGSEGRTLSIAQSAGAPDEDPEAEITVYPCAATLYSDYSYESGLISESFRTAIPAALFFAAGALLLLAFLIRLYRGQRDTALVWAALSLFLWMVGRMADTSFFRSYRGDFAVDLGALCRLGALSVLLAFLSCRAGRYRAVPWTITALSAASGALYLIIDLSYDAFPNNLSLFLHASLPQLAGMAGLCAIIVCACLFWRKENRFYKLFAPLSLLGIMAALAWAAVKRGGELKRQLAYALTYGTPAYFLWPMMLIVTLAALASVAVEVMEQEIGRRAEIRRLAERNELTLASYESLRLQHEQVLMLRHDLSKHLHVLRQMTSEKQTAEYLDELIGQNEKIHPVIASGNQMLDIILNGKLLRAENEGIQIKIVRSQAPETLPISNAELCSLMMNLLDNAINAASNPHLQAACIRLDLHMKSGFFVFSCENSTAEEPSDGGEGKTVPRHGLGLKIIRQIMERHGNLMEVERGPGSYKVTLALPLG